MREGQKVSPGEGPFVLVPRERHPLATLTVTFPPQSPPLLPAPQNSLPYITTHTDLVTRQRAAVEAKKVQAGGSRVANDADWTGDKFVEQSANMVAN